MLRSGAEVLFEDVLSQIARYIYDNSISTIPLKSLLEMLKNTLSDEPSRYYEILCKAEMLKSDESGAVVFWHKSFEDFFLAMSFQGRIDTNEQVLQLIDSQKYETLAYLCGIEKEIERIDRIIWNAKYIDIVIDCLCNSSQVSPHTTTAATQSLINWVEDNNRSLSDVFNYIIKYGARICGQKLFEYLEKKSNENFLQRIDWEILKSEILHIEAIDTRYKEEFYFSERNGLAPAWAQIGDPENNSVIMPDFWHSLADCKLAKGTDAFELYCCLWRTEKKSDLIPLLLKTSYPAEVRAILIHAIIEHHNLFLIQDDDCVKAFDVLRKNKLVFSEDEEIYNWAIVTLVFDCEVSIDIEMQEKFIEIFWEQYTPPVQVKMLAFSSDVLNKQNRQNLYRKILSHYTNDVKVDIELIDKLANGMFYSSLNTILHGSDQIAGEYYLSEFATESYEVLMKCIALDKICEFKADKSLIEKFITHENQKIKSVAKFVYDLMKEA